MEFEGRIVRVLPKRSGTSQRGNLWESLPFVFAYYENDEQRWEDRVYLEAFDTKMMAQIAPFCEIGQDGKVVIENGNVKLKSNDIKCRCGFSHSVKDVTRRDGSGTAIINEMRCYKLEVMSETAVQQTPPPAYQPTPTPQQAPAQANEDDLPF